VQIEKLLGFFDARTVELCRIETTLVRREATLSISSGKFITIFVLITRDLKTNFELLKKVLR
jgi:hypothetical protein